MNRAGLYKAVAFWAFSVYDRANELRKPDHVEMLVDGVYEAVNECEVGNSPPDTGGVAAPSRIDTKPPQRRRRGGWIAEVFRNAF